MTNDTPLLPEWPHHPGCKGKCMWCSILETVRENYGTNGYEWLTKVADRRAPVLAALDQVIAEVEAFNTRGGNHKGWWPIPQIVDLDEARALLAELQKLRGELGGVA